MTNKNKTKTQTQIRNKAYERRQKKGIYGPAQTLGTAIGSLGGLMLGGPFGAAAGGAIGSAIGNGIGYYTGSGDYKVSSNACLVPGYKNSDSTTITHREYICDIQSSTAALVGGSSPFSIEKFPLNPGSPITFPWLASIAANYEEYEILGMIFAFVATSGESVASTNTALGTVIMATEYDPTKPDFVNKQAMENYHFATSAKPSVNQMHAVECAKIRTPVKQLYVRTGANTGTDLRWTDFGNFYIATVGCPAVNTTLGELWVTYKIKLVKPRLPITAQYGGQIASGQLVRTGASTPTPLGTATTLSRGPLAIEAVTGLQFRFNTIPDMDYLVVMRFWGTTTSASAPTLLNAVYKALPQAQTVNTVSTDSATSVTVYFRVSCTQADKTDFIYINPVIVAAACSTEIIVTQLDETL